MRWDINFGAGHWDICITSFNYNRMSGMFHIVLEKGRRVEQIKLSSSEMVERGIINLDEIKKLWIK